MTREISQNIKYLAWQNQIIQATLIEQFHQFSNDYIGDKSEVVIDKIAKVYSSENFFFEIDKKDVIIIKIEHTKTL